MPGDRDGPPAAALSRAPMAPRGGTEPGGAPSLFADRRDAGRRVARALAAYAARAPVLLALPRGGAPVAAEIAAALGAPLDLVLAHKSASRPARAGDGRGRRRRRPGLVRNEDVIRAAGVDERALSRRCTRELRRDRARAAAASRQSDARPSPDAPRLSSTTASPPARPPAPRYARSARARREAVFAAPVAAVDAVAALRSEVDDLVCLETPERFGSVGAFYRDFRQIDDDEVAAILAVFPPANEKGARCVARRSAIERRRPKFRRAARERAWPEA